MIRTGFSALWSFWRRNPLQLFTLVAGLTLATALWSGVQAINAEARASYDAAAAVLGEGQFDQLLPKTGDSLPVETYVALRRAGLQVSPVLEGQLSISGKRVRLIGIDPMTAPEGTGTRTLNTQSDLPDFLIRGIVFTHPDLAALLSGEVGGTIIADPDMAPDTALADIGVIEVALDQKGRLSRLIVVGQQSIDFTSLQELAPNLVLQPAQEGADVGRLTDSFHLNLTAFGLLSFAVGLFIVNGAIGLAFEQRRGLIRTLRALGMPLRFIIFLLIIELACLTIVSGAIGMVLGYFIAASLLPDVAATLEGLYGAQVSGTLQLRLGWWVSGLGMALGGAILAGAGAFWKIANMPLLASPGRRAWAVVSKRNQNLQGVAAVGLLTAAVILIFFGHGLLMAFTCLACLLLGAALVLPLLLNLALSIGQARARQIKWEWFWADTRQQLPGLSLALMALLLAAAANIGVSTMVSSFRLTFVGFLDQRLTSELYVRVDDTTQAAELETFLLAHADEVLPLLFVEARLAGQPTELYGVRVGRTYSENWVFLDAADRVWDTVASGAAVIVNEQLARRAELWVGDTIAVAPGYDLPIAGVFGDYGNPIGQVIIGEALFTRLHPNVEATRFGLRTSDTKAIQDALTNIFGLSTRNIINQSEIKAFSLGVFERTFTVTAALNVLTLAVAGFAILMSLLTLASIRVPQLAPVWALGITRRDLYKLELVRALILALLTLIAALPLGLVQAWVLLAVVNVEAFGWRLPMYLFPLDYARLGAFALLAALFAAFWPAMRLSRTPPSELLKVFTNER